MYHFGSEDPVNNYQRILFLPLKDSLPQTFLPIFSVSRNIFCKISIFDSFSGLNHGRSLLTWQCLLISIISANKSNLMLFYQLCESE